MTYYSYTDKLVDVRSSYWNFKENLKLAGWTITSSGTGSVYSASTDILTAFTDFGSQAWFCASHPVMDGYQRYLCFQMSNTGNPHQARIKTAWAPYSSGTPSASIVPTSTDQQILLGSGTDTAPGFATFLDSTPANNNIYCMVGDITEKFSFYFMSFLPGLAPVIEGIKALWMMQYMVGTNALDIDPFLYAAQNAPTISFSSNFWDGANTTTQPWGWYKKGLTGAAFVRYPFCFHGSSSTSCILGNIGSNPYDNKSACFPAIAMRTTGSQTGIKGTMANIQFTGSARGSLTTNSITTNRDRLSFGPFMTINHNGTATKV